MISLHIISLSEYLQLPCRKCAHEETYFDQHASTWKCSVDTYKTDAGCKPEESALPKIEDAQRVFARVQGMQRLWDVLFQSDELLLLAPQVILERLQCLLVLRMMLDMCYNLVHPWSPLIRGAGTYDCRDAMVCLLKYFADYCVQCVPSPELYFG